MPLYEYKCAKCGHRFEKIENVSASVSKKCPKCGGKAERMISRSAIQFKGSGWYVTDYAGKSKSESSENWGDGAAKPAEKPAEAKSSEKKSSEEKAPAAKPAAEKGSTKKK